MMSRAPSIFFLTQRGLAFFLGVGLLSSCAVGPDFVRPAAPDVTAYVKPSVAAETENSQQKIAPEADVHADWWTLFESPPLNALVQESLAHNATLAAAIATLHQSQHNVQAGYGVFFPQVDAGVSGSRARSAPSGSQLPSSIYNVVTLSGGISYTLDVFGGERRALEGLIAQADYQRYASKAAYVTLSANVVNAAIARAAYAAELRDTQQLIQLEQDQLAATQAQIKAGTASYSSELGVHSLIAANQATLATLQQHLNQTGNLLATLQGQFPVQANLPTIDLEALTLPDKLPRSLPSELVHQRPDILQAEALLHAASAEIGVTTAAMYPSISLTGIVGQAGTSLGNLGGENGRFWSVGPSISIPLFRGGSLWNQRQAALDAYAAAQANYRQTVLAAFADVATTLQALEQDALAMQAQTESRRDASLALTLVQTNCQAGVASYLDVIVADVQYQQASIAYLQTLAQRHQDTVALFVALGGGWWNVEGSGS